jgi:hypothetical protein
MISSATGRSSASEDLRAHTRKAGGRRLFGKAARHRARVGLGAMGGLLAAGALAAGPSAAATPQTVVETFPSTGAEQSFTVPAGVTSVRVRAIGGAGQEGFVESPFESAAPGGVGADVYGQLPVTPGETLYVDVAAPSFNGGAGGGPGGGSGGGASDVRTIPSASPGSLESRLLVAAGGGGGGGTFDEASGGQGGDAGAPGIEGASMEYGGCCGEDAQRTAGGAAGTLTGGGAGGARCQDEDIWSGEEGGFGNGGFGGDEGPTPETGGGGGGGGYWGGGGGEGWCAFGGPEDNPGGGGGGGGASFVSEEAAGASFGLASRSTTLSVTITYATPSTATPSSPTIEFPGTQPLDTVSAPQKITISNEGGNPLALSAETFADSNPVLASDHPEDFLIGSSSCLGAITFEQTCQLTVRFDPQETGVSTATLQLAGNMGAGPTTIALSGAGGTLPQGPQGDTGAQGATGASGATGSQAEPGAKGEAGAAGLGGASGPQGPAGEAGKAGAAGPQGPVGPTGERGPRGLTATYVCHPRRRNGSYKEACFVSIGSASKAAVKASVERDGVTYASATISHAAAAAGLVLKANRKVAAGRYTLVLASKHGTSRETITIG